MSELPPVFCIFAVCCDISYHDLLFWSRGGNNKKNKSISFLGHCLQREKEATENLDSLWAWDGQSFWPSKGDMQARGQHSSITTAQHSSLALPHHGLWVCSPPCHLPKPGAGPMLTQPASKLQVTHGTPTWTYTQSDTGDHQPSHIGEEQEMGNKH